MAFSIAPTIDRVAQTEVMGIPVGKMVLFGAGMGISAALINGAKVANLKPYIAGPALALAALKFRPVGNALGGTLSEVLAITGMVVAAEEQFHFQGYVKYYLARAFDSLGGSEETAAEIAGMSQQEYNISTTTGKPAFAGAPGSMSNGSLGMPDLSMPDLSMPDLAVLPAPPQEAIERAPDLGSIPAGKGYSRVEDRLSRINF